MGSAIRAGLQRHLVAASETTATPMPRGRLEVSKVTARPSPGLGMRVALRRGGQTAICVTSAWLGVFWQNALAAFVCYKTEKVLKHLLLVALP